MKTSGFTLVELLIAVVVAAIVLGGVFAVLVHSMILDGYNENFTIAMNIARARMEEMISYRDDFDGLEGNAASLSGELDMETHGIHGSCVVKVVIDLESSEIKIIRVGISWEDRAGRIIGEDTDLNGVFIVGAEDQNGNGVFDSPCVLTTAIAKG